jgi:hypothetical protein
VRGPVRQPLRSLQQHPLRHLCSLRNRGHLQPGSR